MAVVRRLLVALRALGFEALLRAPAVFLALVFVAAFALVLAAAEVFDLDRFALLAVERADVFAPEVFAPEPALAPWSIGHLPVITRSAASATASAIRAPSFVALVMTEFAALLAVSAASMPASLIALRAFGLALIAAAAAARPAASISLLIAAFAILLAVVLFDVPLFDFEAELLRLVAFAIGKPPFRVAE
ncbi:MAG TPA: hypothetical protein VMK31_02030 [Sphingomicrobium sp.]|nr:hypothetical protein [Sphingomicrobium sp.]